VLQIHVDGLEVIYRSFTVIKFVSSLADEANVNIKSIAQCLVANKARNRTCL
jgi:hypothetical protein